MGRFVLAPVGRVAKLEGFMVSLERWVARFEGRMAKLELLVAKLEGWVVSQRDGWLRKRHGWPSDEMCDQVRGMGGFRGMGWISRGMDG
jgi:hypothetical protein